MDTIKELIEQREQIQWVLDNVDLKQRIRDIYQGKLKRINEQIESS